jgi:hypothetical protein
MIIEINDSKTVGDIQREFSSRFPFLKMEFFHTPHGREEASNEPPCLPEQTIGSIRERHVLGIIAINTERETGSVEQEFEHRFGLHVQVYRKQSDGWIQTVGTDMLSLGEQNKVAMNFSFNVGQSTAESGIA